MDETDDSEEDNDLTECSIKDIHVLGVNYLQKTAKGWVFNKTYYTVGVSEVKRTLREPKPKYITNSRMVFPFEEFDL